MTVATISPQELATHLQQPGGIDLIDVRTPVEFQALHLRGARNIPLNQLDVAQIQQQRGDAPRPLYVVCHSGSRGRQACEQFQAAGVAQVFNVAGGTIACTAAGLDVVRGRSVMSLERQVRIAAGSLVLLGIGLGYFVHPAGLALSAFVGAGLIFAGLTDTCGMGLLLAKMPWNQVAASDNACSLPPRPVS